MTRVLMAEDLWDVLVKAGVLDRVQDSWDRRIVIDAQQGQPVRMYIERYATDSLFRVELGNNGIEVMAAHIDHEHFLPGSPEAADYMGADYWLDSEGKRIPYPPRPKQPPEETEPEAEQVNGDPYEIREPPPPQHV